MTNEERAEMHQRARSAAADHSYGDNTNTVGRILEVRKAKSAYARTERDTV